MKINVRAGNKENEFLAKIKMPNFISMKEINYGDKKLIFIEFSGIKHFIYKEKVDIKENNEQEREEIINFVENYLSKTEYSAFGIMFYDENKNYMTPYIQVKGFETGIWENSCASGTTALGFYLNKYKNINRAKVIQPNGWLEFSFENEEIYINGPVIIIAEGKVYI